MLFAVSLQEVFYVVGSLYMGLMFLVTLGAIIAAVVLKRRVKKKLDEIKKFPLRGRTFVTTFLHALFNK